MHFRKYKVIPFFGFVKYRFYIPCLITYKMLLLQHKADHILRIENDTTTTISLYAFLPISTQ